MIRNVSECGKFVTFIASEDRWLTREPFDHFTRAIQVPIAIEHTIIEVANNRVQITNQNNFNRDSANSLDLNKELAEISSVIMRLQQQVSQLQMQIEENK